MATKTQVVIFVFVKDKAVLVENRFVKSLKQTHYLMPGGTVKGNEEISEALKREAREELGINLLDFTQIPVKQEILGIHNQILIPFLVTKYEGRLPDVILDKGTPLIWVEIDELLSNSFEPTRKIIKRLISYSAINVSRQGLQPA